MAILLAVQLVLFGAVLALMWRKLDQMSAELTRLREAVESMELDRVGAKKSRARAQPAMAASEASVMQSPPVESAWPAQRSVERPVERMRPGEPPLVVVDDIEEPPPWRAAFTPARLRRAAAVALVAAPLAALFFTGWHIASAAGLVLAGLALLVSLREQWRDAAWIGAIGSGAWVTAALTTGASEYAPLLISLSAALAGVSGLTHLRLRETAAGALTTLVMGGALLILGARIGMIGPAGGAYAALVAISAVLGAWRLRLEPLHVAAFVAAGAGLFIHSAEETAAIWFTPAAAIAGALFLGIAAARVPLLGSRGVMLAGTGVAASLFAVAALYVSQQGLANPYFASAAFVALAAVLGGLIGYAAHRRPGGVTGLKVTLWVLAFGAFAAFTSGVFVSMPAPLAAAAMAAAAAGLAFLDVRVRTLAWRVFGVAALLCSATAAGAAALHFMSVTPEWPRWASILVGFGAPALFAAMAARSAERAGALRTSDLTDGFAIAFALAGGSLALRYGFSGGSPDQVPIGFIEAGAQVALWLAVGLALAGSDRRGVAVAVTIPALAAGLVSGLLWLTPYWLGRPMSGIEWGVFQHAPLGFLLMAIAAWAHWAYWRGRDANTRKRVTYGAAALATAAFITHEAILLRAGAVTEGSDWVVIGVATTVFAVAIVTTMAPGIAGHLRPRYLRQRV